MSMNVLPVCACNAYGFQKRASYPLELELWRVRNHHVGSGNRTLFLWKNNEHSSRLSCCSSGPRALGLCSLPVSCILSLASRSTQTPISSLMFLQPQPPACLAALTSQQDGLSPHILSHNELFLKLPLVRNLVTVEEEYRIDWSTRC